MPLGAVGNKLDPVNRRAMRVLERNKTYSYYPGGKLVSAGLLACLLIFNM